MKDESISNFGLLIAYLLPGCVVLWGLGQPMTNGGDHGSKAKAAEAPQGASTTKSAAIKDAKAGQPAKVKKLGEAK